MRAEMAATGELPLDYMLRVMRDPTVEPHRRDAMAPIPLRKRSAAECTAPAQTTTSDADSEIGPPPRAASAPRVRTFSMCKLTGLPIRPELLHLSGGQLRV